MFDRAVPLNRGMAASPGLRLLMGAGCRCMGPATVKRDWLHHLAGVADLWEEQLRFGAYDVAESIGAS
jgi:hypothetical protein